MKLKEMVPDADYKVIPNIRDTTHRSDWGRNPRDVIAAEIMKRSQRDLRPDPSSYKINLKQVEKKPKGSFKYKEVREDTNFLADCRYLGSFSPKFHNINHN